MLDVGWLGSPVDVATFVVVVTMFVYELRPTVDKLSAAIVALATEVRNVDHARLQDELEVDDEEVDALRPTIVHADHADREEDHAG